MKLICISIVYFFSITSACAQFFELTEDRGYSNRYSDVLNVGDSLWIVGGFYQYGNVGQKGTYVKALDQTGQELWSFDATSSQGRIFDIILNSEQELVVMGGYQIPCDIVVGYPVFFTRLNLQGELLSEYNHELNLGPFDRSELIELPSGEMVFASDVVSPDGGEYSNSLFSFNATGEQLLWESDWEDQSIDNIANINGSVIVFCDSQLYMVDNTGNPIDSLPYSSPPLDSHEFQENSILLLWEDSVYVLNETLELVPVFAVDDESESATRVFFHNQSIYVWFNSILKEYTVDFEFIGSAVFDILPYFNTADLQMNDSEICIVGNKSFDVIPVSNGGFYRSAALAFYNLSESTQQFDADIAVRHLESTFFSANQTNENPTLFHFEAEVSGYVVNTGNEEIQSVNINFLGDQGICGVNSERLHLSDISLLPGDSIPFTMGELEYWSVYVSGNTGTVDFCVFASVPSELYDRDETNDARCVSTDFGVGINDSFPGISSIYPNPASEHLTIDFSENNMPDVLQIYDASGRQVETFSVNRHNQLTLDVANWNMGLYYFRTISDGRISEPVKVSVAR